MKGFYDFQSEGMERNERAAAAVRARHEALPFQLGNGSIAAAFQEEIQLLERSALNDSDRDELALMGISA